jgi:hypothetical protein
MKKVRIYFTAIIVTLTTTVMAEKTSKSLNTEITINAPIEKVWEVLMDHENYEKWNPFITSIKGNTEQGGKLKVVIHPENQKAMAFKPKVLKNESQTEFRWIGKLLIKGVFDGEHFFKVVKIDDNTTKFIQGENFSGLLSGMIMKKIEANTQKGFESMNQALKERAEAL